MLSNAYFLAKFRFDTAENEPAKNLQNFAKFANFDEVTLAKDGSLHARRQALGYMYDKQLVHALFEQAPERYAERNGGYTRVLKDGFRRGDNAEMGIIELV